MHYLILCCIIEPSTTRGHQMHTIQTALPEGQAVDAMITAFRKFKRTGERMTQTADHLITVTNHSEVMQYRVTIRNFTNELLATAIADQWDE